jgi:hemolysin III
MSVAAVVQATDNLYYVLMSQRTSWLEQHISLHSYDTPREERANAATHGIGAFLAPLGLLLLVLRGVGEEPWTIVLSDAVFGLAMVLLYGNSTLYHVSNHPKWKRLFRVLDHMSIYILIAGTYTPLMARIDAPWAGRTLLLVWLLAAGGMAFKLLFWGRFRVLQVLFYLGMGWLAIIRIEELYDLLPSELIWSILAGGLFYTVGTVIYALKRMPFYHAVWHLFVLGGSGSFFYGIYSYL